MNRCYIYGVLFLGLNLYTSVSCHQSWNYIDLLHEPNRKLSQLNSEQNSLASIDLLNPDLLSINSERLLNILEDNGGSNMSDKCVNDTGLFVASLLERQEWALTMFDAFGKPKPGILAGTLIWEGLYEECIKIKVPLIHSANGSDVGSFNGQYCTAFLLLGGPPPMPASFFPANGLSLGVCLPDSCTSQEMVILMNTALDDANITNLTYRFSEVASTCQKGDQEYEGKAQAAIIVGAIFLMLLVIGTLYDIINIQMPKWTYSARKQTGAVNVESNDDDELLLGKSSTGKETDKSDKIPDVFGKILLSFSVYSNGMKILSTKQPKGSLTSVHGIRFLSMTWVILGHTFIFGNGVIDNFAIFFPPLLKSFAFQVILSAPFSVDTFFMLSGLLVAYLTLKELKKKDGKLNWFMFYFHRYWRLTPPYMLLMLIYIPLFPHITNGPFWPEQGVEINQCKDTWWTNLLYVNNVVKKDQQCMGWSWYLANDMQFYILSPLLILPLYYSKLYGLITCGVFLLTVIITPASLSVYYKLSPALISTSSPLNFNYFLEYYNAPYCRMGPYIIGVVTGYYLYKTELKLRWNKAVVVIGWCVSIATALAVVYGLYYSNHYDEQLSTGVAALYNAVSRTVWAACVSWVIVACVGGYGGPVNVLLSWKGFIPLSRLTYCAYLLHPIIMYAFYFGQKKALHFTSSLVVFLFFGFLVSAYMLAFLLSLMFESPMMGLENVIFKRSKKDIKQ